MSKLSIVLLSKLHPSTVDCMTVPNCTQPYSTLVWSISTIVTAGKMLPPVQWTLAPTAIDYY